MRSGRVLCAFAPIETPVRHVRVRQLLVVHSAFVAAAAASSVSVAAASSVSVADVAAASVSVADVAAAAEEV